MVKTVYIIGIVKPVAEAFDAFHETQIILEKEGYQVTNFMQRLVMGSDIDRLHKQLELMLGCTSVAIMKGWSNNDDAIFLFLIAKKLGLHIIYL